MKNNNSQKNTILLHFFYQWNKDFPLNNQVYEEVHKRLLGNFSNT